MDINKRQFKNWLMSKYREYAPITIDSIISEAWLIERENLGITPEDILTGKKTINDYTIIVRDFLINKGKNPKYRPNQYASSLNKLILFLRDDEFLKIES